MVVGDYSRVRAGTSSSEDSPALKTAIFKDGSTAIAVRELQPASVRTLIKCRIILRRLLRKTALNTTSQI